MRKKKIPDSETESPPTSPPPRAKFTGGLPDAVPVLIAEDICPTWTTADGRRDLASWLEVTFNPNDDLRPPKCFDRAYGLLLEALSDGGTQYASLFEFLEEAAKTGVPLCDHQADSWNAMLVKLGYEI